MNKTSAKVNELGQEFYKEVYKELLKHYYYKNNRIPENRGELDIESVLSGLNSNANTGAQLENEIPAKIASAHAFVTDLIKTAELEALVKEAISQQLVSKAMGSDVAKKGYQHVWDKLGLELTKPGSDKIQGGQYEKKLLDAFEEKVMPLLDLDLLRSFIINR